MIVNGHVPGAVKTRSGPRDRPFPILASRRAVASFLCREPYMQKRVGVDGAADDVTAPVALSCSEIATLATRHAGENGGGGCILNVTSR